MIMTPQAPELAPLRKLRDTGQLSPSVYCKQVVRLASERVDVDATAALNLIRSLPPDYFRYEICQQMLDDPEFGDQAFLLSLMLVETGTLPESSDLACSMRPAIA